MASGRSRSYSGSATNGRPNTYQETALRIRQSVIRNDDLAKKIKNRQVLLRFKYDTEVRHLEKMIDSAKKKLTEMQAVAMTELKLITKSRQENLLPLVAKCTDRALRLRRLIENAKIFSDETMAEALAEISSEVAETSKQLDSYGKYNLRTSKETRELCEKVFKDEKALFIQSDLLLPAEVRLIYIKPQITPADPYAPVIITIKAEPKYKTTGLQQLLTATVELLSKKPVSGTVYKLLGCVTSWDDDFGSAKISFPPVSPAKDYVIRVLFRDQTVSNSPMILHLPPVSEDAKTLWFADQSQLQQSARRRIQSCSNAESSPGDNELVCPTPSSAWSASSSLNFLASRARFRSGSPSRQRHPSGTGRVAVAPKGILTNGKRKRDNEPSS